MKSLSLVFVLISFIFLCGAKADDGYFYLPPGSANVSSLTEADYLQITTELQNKYSAAVQKQTGKPLIIPNDWTSPFFAGFAIQRADHIQISMWGGLVRAPGANREILAAVLCHEIGHALGGEPRQTIQDAEWTSTEGQADFFAASVCLPQYLTEHPELVTATSPEAQKLCQGNILCARVAQVGFELVSFMQKYSYHEFTPVSLSAQAPPTKELIRNSYPSDQCRLDTYVQGGLCQLGPQCRAPVCWLPK